MLPVAAHLSSAQGPHRIVSAVLICQASTCFRMGSKFRCIRSTPTEMQSTSENDFECLASTGVNTPGTMFPKLKLLTERVVTEDFHRRLPGESDDSWEYRRTLNTVWILLRRSGTLRVSSLARVEAAARNPKPRSSRGSNRGYVVLLSPP